MAERQSVRAADQTGDSRQLDENVADALDEPRLLTENGLARRVGAMIEPALHDLGLRLVRVRISAADGATVQVMAERADGSMTIGDCERASLAVSPVLDLENLFARAYRLEISSPGIDRPLTRASDFRRAVGHEARIEMATPVGGRKRFRGLVEAVEDDGSAATARLRLAARDGGDGDLVSLPVNEMNEARLVLTEDLIRAALRRDRAVRKRRKARRGGPLGDEAPPGEAGGTN
jgi:ribosome maturation factor RimP